MENLIIPRPGDFFATAGTGPVSRIIQVGTLSKYSHIGCFYSEDIIVKSTQLREYTGVVKHPVADLHGYKGTLYHLRMIDSLYENLNIERLQKDLNDRVGVKYDLKQAALSGIDWFWIKRFKTKFDEQKLFCSEMASIVLKNQRLISNLINPSETTPKDFVRMPIWETITKFEVTKEGDIIAC